MVICILLSSAPARLSLHIIKYHQCVFSYYSWEGRNIVSEHALSRSDKQRLGYTYRLVFKYLVHDGVIVEQKRKMLSLCAYYSCFRKFFIYAIVQCIFYDPWTNANNENIKSGYFYESSDKICIT